MIFPSPAEGPSGAEGFLPSLILSLPTFPCLAASHHLLGLPQKSRKSSVMNTYKKCVRNSFRMNTCKTLDLKYLCFQHLREIGGWGVILLTRFLGSLLASLFRYFSVSHHPLCKFSPSPRSTSKRALILSTEPRLWRLLMDRSVLSALFGSFIGISALGLLGFVSANPSPAPDPPKGDGNWRLLNPITYENISVFPVVAGSTYDTGHFLTLEEVLASGEVIVSEQGSVGIVRNRGDRVTPNYSSGASVNQLVLVNRSKRPLLLLAGELVSGGKQDRIIGKDRIVPTGAEPLPLDVFCVEHGRWSSGGNFSATKTIVHPSVREQAAVNQKQADVWNAVRSGTTSSVEVSGAGSGGGVAAPAPRVSGEMLSYTMANEAPTESYDKLYNKSRSIGGSVESVVEEVQRRFAKETSGLKNERVVGVVVAYGGEVAWSDIFASEDLFYKYWTKLLRSYAVEALARPNYREVADSGDAEQFLLSLRGVIKEETEPGVYRWREINHGRLSQIELDALEPKAITLHRLLLRRTS